MNARRHQDASARPVLCIINQAEAGMDRFGGLLTRRGLRLKEVDAATADVGSIDLDAVGGLVSLGGEMGAHEAERYPHLDTEIDLLRAAHACGVPILGVCLGGQLLAAALGAPVRARRGGEVGWLEVDHLVDDMLLGPVGTRPQLQWHYDSFELPDGAERLASSAACPNQAFRCGRSYGIQFHPEVSNELLGRWVASDDARDELRQAGVNSDQLLAQGRRLDHCCQRQAETMMTGFARLVSERA